MIITNGTIEVKRKTAGGIDPETGFPVKSSEVSWGSPIDCQYTANKYNKLGKVNGEHFTVAQYSILIEEQPLGEFDLIRLSDSLRIENNGLTAIAALCRLYFFCAYNHTMKKSKRHIRQIHQK